MRTMKRAPAISDNSSYITNYNKSVSYFNQLDFKGIMEDDNIFTTDQESFKDSKNVYVNVDDQLVSRPTLQRDNLPNSLEVLLAADYILVDIQDAGPGKIYVLKATKNTTEYPNIAGTFTVAYIPDDNSTVITPMLEHLNKYHISLINHYIICFNNSDIGAQVINTDKRNDQGELIGWESFNKYVNIPITKSTTGGTTTEYPKNQFTDAYKESYIWSNESKPILPTGTADEVKLITSNETIVYNDENNKYIPDTNILTDFRLIRSLSYIDNGQESQITVDKAGKNRICIAFDTYFLYSLNSDTFTQIYYPAETLNSPFAKISSITDDGLGFYAVFDNGVYYFDFDTQTWSTNSDDNKNVGLILNNTGLSNICRFVSKDVYTFMTEYYAPNISSVRETYLYFKAPGLYSGTDITKTNILSRIRLTNDSYGLGLSGMQDVRDKLNLTKFIAETEEAYVLTRCTNNSIEVYIGGTTFNTAGQEMINGETSNSEYENIYITNLTSEVSVRNEKPALTLEGTVVTKKGTNPIKYYTGGVTIKRYYEQSYTGSIDIRDAELLSEYNNNYYMPSILLSAYISDLKLIDKITGDSASIPNNKYNPEYNYSVYVTGDYFYYIYNGKIYTNYLHDTDIATIVYTINASSVYKDVPTVSYSDSELYLGFNNKLKISYNINKGTEILFDLPELNNQSFIDNINAIINISTTDVALFFKDSIKVVSKVEDSNFEAGFRYSLTNTKLSTGVRLGDDVINSLEGTYTLFPTRRGLAALSYQAFMATTDQTLTYITDTIKNNWQNFYNNSQTIKMIQWKTYLIVTNNTSTVLLYNIIKGRWWKWEIPVIQSAPLKMLTDQEVLQVMNKQLNVFQDSYIYQGQEIIPDYYDFSKTSTDYKTYRIDWSMSSQPLHFNAINYYKNIKQLVFQFFDKKDTEVAKTILAHIKLYRKKITETDPEVIAFSVEQLRTFVKRFNYWKINELQWELANDPNNSNPGRFELNGIGVKYEIGEQVR